MAEWYNTLLTIIHLNIITIKISIFQSIIEKKIILAVIHMLSTNVDHNAEQKERKILLTEDSEDTTTFQLHDDLLTPMVAVVGKVIGPVPCKTAVN